MNVKAALKIQLWAGPVLVAESIDQDLWSRNFVSMRAGHDHSDPPNFVGMASETAVIPLGGSLDKFAAEIDVPLAAVQSACNPASEPPYLRLDAHRWASLKQNTPKRGPQSVPPITLAGTLLCLWFRHSRPDQPPSVSEAQGVLATMLTRDQNPARALRSCPWLGRAGKLILLKPDSITAAVELARAFCLRQPPAEAVFAGRARVPVRKGGGHRQVRTEPMSTEPKVTIPGRPLGSSRRGRRGPKATFAAMHDDGFFDQPRTGREAQTHARDRLRTDVPTNNVHAKLGDLVQEGVLKRERDSEGVFRYSTARVHRGARAAFSDRTAVAPPGDAPPHRRNGARSILEQLCESSFFATPRRSSDVRSHVKHSLGHSLTTKEIPKTLLRLVQSGLLSRRRGADGEYEYLTPGRSA